MPPVPIPFHSSLLPAHATKTSPFKFPNFQIVSTHITRLPSTPYITSYTCPSVPPFFTPQCSVLTSQKHPLSNFQIFKLSALTSQDSPQHIISHHITPVALLFHSSLLPAPCSVLTSQKHPFSNQHKTTYHSF